MADIGTVDHRVNLHAHHIASRSRDRMMRIRVMGHAEMGPNTSWEMWILPEAGGKPISLGLITTHETQVMKIPAALAAKLDAAPGLAMSVEPAGGSPTGIPTGPVLYVGNSIKT